MKKAKAAIIGPGNIGLDLLHKIKRSDWLEPVYMVGVKDSLGIATAAGMGLRTTTDGIDGFIRDCADIDLVFDCTSAAAHQVHAPLLQQQGIFTLDLTPAAVGPYVVPAVNLDESIFDLPNINLVTCAGQATTPIVAAINRAVGVSYAEVISSISSKSAGPGTRANIDEFTVTTKRALETIGGAQEARVIIVLNPAEPPIYMRNTIYTRVKDPDLDKIQAAVTDMVERIRTYVPGYSLLLEPILQGDIVTTMMQVAGLGDYLPVYSGNLDIITAAAVYIAEKYASSRLGR